MPEKQLVEHLDLLTSIGTNNARRGFLPYGRYYGFDIKATGTLGSPTGFPVNIEHNELMHYTDESNVDSGVAALITRQGTVIFTEGVAELEVFFQSTIKYQIVYGKYTWVAALGGSTMSLGTLPQVDDEPTDPFDLTGLAADEFPIGYFILAANGVGLTDITWMPWSKPNLAGKPDMDLSGYAKLAETNKFTATNKFGFSELTDINLISITDSWGPDPRRLSLPADGGNVFTLNSTNTNPWTLTRILREGGNVQGDWCMIQVIGMAEGVTIQSDIGGDSGIVHAPADESAKTSVRQLSILFFQYTNGAWSLVGNPTYVGDKIRANLAAISSLVDVTNNHEARIQALEDAGETAIEWHDIVPYAWGYTWTYFQYSVDTLNSLGRIRGRVLVPAGTRPSNKQISSGINIAAIANADDNYIPATAWDSANHALAQIRVSSTGGVYLNTKGVDESASSGTDIIVQFDGTFPIS